MESQFNFTIHRKVVVWATCQVSVYASSQDDADALIRDMSLDELLDQGKYFEYGVETEDPDPLEVEIINDQDQVVDLWSPIQ